eukprot:4168275-Pyramimonas_sp.AAC.1
MGSRGREETTPESSRSCALSSARSGPARPRAVARACLVEAIASTLRADILPTAEPLWPVSFTGRPRLLTWEDAATAVPALVASSCSPVRIVAED